MACVCGPGYAITYHGGEHGDCKALLTKEDSFSQQYENIIPIAEIRNPFLLSEQTHRKVMVL